MTCRFALSHPLVASAVVGATSAAQLEELVAAAASGPLADAVLEAIDGIHRKFPDPNP
jgi:N-acetyltransferase 10